MKNKTLQRIIGIFLTVSVMVIIFLMSAQNAKISSNTSGSVIAFFAKILTPDFNNLSIEQQAQIISSYQFVVRKMAHFTIYLCLGVASSVFTFTLDKLKRIYQYMLSAGIALLYAISDEIHQLYVPGRAGAITDVIIDFSGTLTGLLLLFLLLSIIKKIKNKKSVE